MTICAKLCVEMGGQHIEQFHCSDILGITSDMLARLLSLNVLKFKRAIAPKCDHFGYMFV
jgi:hypothetical protein